MVQLPQANFTGQFFTYHSPELNKKVIAEYIGKDDAGSAFFQLHIDENTVVEKAFADWEIKQPIVRSRFKTIEVPKVVEAPVVAPAPSAPQKFRVKVKQWLTRRDNNPVPMREMLATVEAQTRNAVLVTMQGFIAPSTHCLHCNRPLSHPVSLLYGIGPTCGGHFHINPLRTEEELNARYDEMCETMSNVTWRGWIPRSQIERMRVFAQ
jgi:hypothetical protein